MLLGFNVHMFISGCFHLFVSLKVDQTIIETPPDVKTGDTFRLILIKKLYLVSL